MEEVKDDSSKGFFGSKGILIGFVLAGLVVGGIAGFYLNHYQGKTAFQWASISRYNDQEFASNSADLKMVRDAVLKTYDCIRSSDLKNPDEVILYNRSDKSNDLYISDTRINSCLLALSVCSLIPGECNFEPLLVQNRWKPWDVLATPSAFLITGVTSSQQMSTSVSFSRKGSCQDIYSIDGKYLGRACGGTLTSPSGQQY